MEEPYDLTLTVYPNPAALTGDIVGLCMNSPSTALAVTADSGNTIKWYVENQESLNQAPVINTSAPGETVFYAIQSNAYGCKSPASKFVAVVNPVAKIVSSSYTDPTSCGIPSGSVTLNVVDLNGNVIPNFPVHVHYTKSGERYSRAANTDDSGEIVIPLTEGAYSEIYVETNGCLSQNIPDIFVLKGPSTPVQPVAGYNGPICTESTLNLSASSPTSSQAGPIDYIWTGPAFGSLPYTTQNTVFSFPSAQASYNGIYVVYAKQNNCISPPVTFPVEIKQAPVKPEISTKTPLCVGDNLTLRAYSSITGNGALDYVWSGPGRGFPVRGANAGITGVNVDDGGVYAVTITSPVTGCSVSFDTLIEIGGRPVVKFAQDTLKLPAGYILHLPTSIVNASDVNILPISQYEWTPPQNIQCDNPDCASITTTIKNNICYTVKATNIYGCSGSDTICISTFCNDAQVFIPNAFTPRGLATNSRFMIRASGIASIKSFRVFNRWGRIVFEKNNFQPN